jgi:hypothetical protein
MKKMYTLMSMIFLMSCGSDTVEVKDGTISVGDAMKLGANISSEYEKIAERIDARKSKGDTLPLTIEELKEYLPAIAGFEKKGREESNTMDVPGMGSWSELKQSFSSANEEFDFHIFDYTASSTALMAATAMFTTGVAIEDNEKRAEPVDLGVKGIKAQVIHYKNRKKAELILVASDRFLLQCALTGSNDKDKLVAYVKSIDLNSLANR